MTIITEMSAELGLGTSDIMRIVATAPRRYKVYTIPKRHGRGVRIIAQPSYELKFLQRFILERKLSPLPIHPAATGYVTGKNIRENAEAHRKNHAILKLDFKDFFPSIRVRDFQRLAKNNPQLFERADIPLCSRILFWGAGKRDPVCLSIGAPSSPMMSNVLMFEIDNALQQLAAGLGVIYTRYADDITASAMRSEPLYEFEQEAKRVIKDTKSPSLAFNTEKRGLFLRGQRRMVTGLVITPTGRISVGRQRKRYISSLLHHAKLGTIDVADYGKLKGLLGFCVATEPAFLDRMRRKYGNETIDAALSYHVPTKGIAARPR